MKKHISILVVILFSFTSFIYAQELNPANLLKSALKLTRTTTLTNNSKTEVMGQDMENNLKSTTVFNIDISAATEQGATAEIKTTAIKMESESMGQEMSYDSEKPEEGNREIAAQSKDMMKNTIKINFDANGFITSIKGNEKLTPIKNDVGNKYERGEFFEVFLKLSKTVKPGDNWEEKDEKKDYKTNSVITYKSFENGIAKIEKISTVIIDQKIEQMGMIMFSTLEGTVVENLEVDPTTLLIKSRTSISNLKGFIDARGTKMPITSFMTTTETIQ
jgi:hypothetical protein